MLILGVPILSAILAFVIVVFVHELGHYLVGRWCGIGATAFSIGFGPKLVSVIDRRQTEWMICLIPLGGYVKFLTAETTKNSTVVVNKIGNSNIVGQPFETASLLSRTLTVLAGPIANFILSLIIFSYVTSSSGIMSQEPIIGSVAKLPINQQALKIGDIVLSVDKKPVFEFKDIFEVASKADRNFNIDFEIKRGSDVIIVSSPHIFQPIVFGVEMFSPAMKAGIRAGDVFLEANKKIISSFDDLKTIINNSDGDPVSVKVWNNGEIKLISIIPELRPTETEAGDIQETMRIGIRGGPIFSPLVITPSIVKSVLIGTEMTFYVIKMSIVGLVRIIDNSISPKHLSGPIGVAKALSYTASEGLIPFLSLLAAISSGIGLVNLFPIPVLDGGHLMFFVYEALFKRPPPSHIVRYLMVFGVSILLALMAFATFNDIVR